MCLNSPIQIPVGSNGKSVFIAYAQSSTGTGFSYTPAHSRTYISFVVKKGTVTQSDFTTWTKYIGTDGTNGTNGTSISNVYVSDGVTAIGGTIYTVNTVVVLLSSGIYINAGEIDLSLTWNTLTLLNGWVSGTGVNVAEYAVDNNFLYLRGIIDGNSAVNNVFALLAGVANTGIISVTIATPTPVIRSFTLNASQQISCLAGDTYILDTVQPISIR